MLQGINYWDAVAESPSQLEICFAIFANVLELDDQGDPMNEKHAERRAPYGSTGTAPGNYRPGEAGLEPMARVQAEWAATLPSPRSTAWRSPSWRTYARRSARFSPGGARGPTSADGLVLPPRYRRSDQELALLGPRYERLELP
jgi:hypothetical protein